MKKYIIILALFMLSAFTGCRTNSQNPVPQQERYQRLSMEYAEINDNITLVNMTTTLRQGENGSLTIRGKPGKVYTVATTFRLNAKTYVTTRSGTADSNGMVTWNWNVAPGTRPGSYPVTVKCGNDKLNTIYTVLE